MILEECPICKSKGLIQSADGHGCDGYTIKHSNTKGIRFCTYCGTVFNARTGKIIRITTQGILYPVKETEYKRIAWRR